MVVAVVVLLLFLMGLIWWWGREGKWDELIRPALRPFREEDLPLEVDEGEEGAASEPTPPAGGSRGASSSPGDAM